MWFVLSLLTVLYHPYSIPSESNAPTLQVGDYVIAARIAPAVARRGDMLVFRHPVQGQDFVKRLIGLPGDTVQMQDGVVILNGQPLPQTPDGSFDVVYAPQGAMGLLPRCANAPVAMGGTCTRARLIETLPDGRSHAILNIEDNGVADNTDLFTVPPGMLFFMGDNRDNSFDSRFPQDAGGLGFVPVTYVRARADHVLYSATGTWLAVLWTWRASRFWKAVE